MRTVLLLAACAAIVACAGTQKSAVAPTTANTASATAGVPRTPDGEPAARQSESASPHKATPRAPIAPTDAADQKASLGWEFRNFDGDLVGLHKDEKTGEANGQVTLTTLPSGGKTATEHARAYHDMLVAQTEGLDVTEVEANADGSLAWFDVADSTNKSPNSLMGRAVMAQSAQHPETVILGQGKWYRKVADRMAKDLMIFVAESQSDFNSKTTTEERRRIRVRDYLRLNLNVKEPFRDPFTSPIPNALDQKR